MTGETRRHLQSGRAMRAAPGISWRECVFVLGGFGFAGLATLGLFDLGTGVDWIGPLWAAAIAWTVVAQIAHALWRGLRYRDRSAFGACEPPGDDTLDWSTRTGAYSYMRVAEEHNRLMSGGDDWVRHDH